MYKRAKKSWMKHVDFILLDLLCMQLSYIFAYGMRYLYKNGQFKFVYTSWDYRMIGITLVFLHFMIVVFSDNYSGILRRGKLVEFEKTLVYNMTLLGGLFAYLVLVRFSSDVSRMTLINFAGINLVMMYIERTTLKEIFKKRNLTFNNQTHMLIVTTKMEVDEITSKIKDLSNDINIVGIALITEEKIEGDAIQGIPIVAYNSNDTYEYACRNVVDEVFIYIPGINSDTTGIIANNFIEMGITVHINLDMLSNRLPNVAIEKISDYTVLTTSIHVINPVEAFLKRCIDIAAGLAGCLVTGILYIFLAPAIKITDPGPVFFGQKRVGKNGRIFTIYKFRSMYQDAEERKKELMKKNKMDGLMFKMDEDPRIIGSGPDGKRKGLGYWMRTLSLDEFPNFYSILKGDMSFVGTRPPTVDEYKHYSLHHKSRLAAKPGLTGMWQVSGRSDMTNFEEIVALDAEYIRNWSLALDIKIIFKTVLVVLRRKGSY